MRLGKTGQILEQRNPDLAKVGVEGSSPFARSKFPWRLNCLPELRTWSASSESLRGSDGGSKTLLGRPVAATSFELD